VKEERGAIFYGETRNISSFADFLVVTTRLPVKTGWREGKALGSEEGKALGSAKNRGVGSEEGTAMRNEQCKLLKSEEDKSFRN
jgi:hypothetical protein